MDTEKRVVDAVSNTRGREAVVVEENQVEKDVVDDMSDFLREEVAEIMVGEERVVLSVFCCCFACC